MNKLVTILSFSSRNNGNCSNISKYISNYYPNVNFSVIDSNTIQSCGGCDYECLKPHQICPRLSDGYTQIMVYLKSRKYGKESIEGDILNSDIAKADLEAFLSRASL